MFRKVEDIQRKKGKQQWHKKEHWNYDEKKWKAEKGKKYQKLDMKKKEKKDKTS